MKSRLARRILIGVVSLVALAGIVILVRRPVKRWYRQVTYEHSDGRFQDPEGLAVDAKGNFYVADEDWHRFTMLSPEGKVIAQFEEVDGYRGVTGTGHITAGDSLIALGEGRVIVIAQFNLAEIEILDGKPKLLRVIGGTKGTGRGDFGDPEGLSRDPENGDLYVTDEDNRRIQVFGEDGTLKRAWPVPVDPESICVAGDRVYVTFSKDDWVGCYSKEGKLRFRFGEKGGGEGEFRTPDFVCVSPEGLLYITDQKNDRIQVFDKDGTYRFSIGRSGRGPGEFRDPEDLAFDPKGNLVVADGGNHRIQVLTKDGKFLRQLK